MIAAGDRVAFRAAFLRSIFDYSHDSASKRGTVTETPLAMGERALCRVAWDNGTIQTVLDCNLIHADRIHLEPN